MCTLNDQPVCIAKSIQCVLARIQPRRYHGNLGGREGRGKGRVGGKREKGGKGGDEGEGEWFSVVGISLAHNHACAYIMHVRMSTLNKTGVSKAVPKRR